MKLLESRALRLLSLSAVALATAFTVQLILAQESSRQVNPQANPCAGLGQEETKACHTAITADARRLYVEWLDDFVRSGRDVGSLPRRAVEGGRMEPPKLDLATAVSSSDVIVVADVEHHEFIPSLRFATSAVVTMRVGSVLKGNATEGEALKVNMPGGPYPNPDYKDGYLQYLEHTPLLMPGERAVVFLVEHSGELWPQPYTGLYQVRNGQITTAEGNPFGSLVDGQLEAVFVGQVDALVP